MPNWCDQELFITGEKKSLDKFVEFAKSEERELDHEKFIPMPESLREVSAGSDDMLYDIWFGNLDTVNSYTWVPDNIKGDREKLKKFFRKRHGKKNAD